MHRKGMTINKVRSALYGAARALGDVQAVERSVETGSVEPIAKRLARRLIGKLTGRLLGRMFR